LRESCEKDLLPHRALATGDAFPARLMTEEARDPFERLDDADPVVEDHDAARSELGADPPQRVEVHRDIDLVGPERGRGSRAGDHESERASAADAAGVLLDELA